MATTALHPPVTADNASDLDTLHRLNHEFVRAVNERNADWFDVNTSPDFMNSNPDGTLVGRAARASARSLNTM